MPKVRGTPSVTTRRIIELVFYFVKNFDILKSISHTLNVRLDALYRVVGNKKETAPGSLFSLVHQFIILLNGSGVYL